VHLAARVDVDRTHARVGTQPIDRVEAPGVATIRAQHVNAEIARDCADRLELERMRAPEIGEQRRVRLLGETHDDADRAISHGGAHRPLRPLGDASRAEGDRDVPYGERTSVQLKS
jgi:hypothetical protein